MLSKLPEEGGFIENWYLPDMKNEISSPHIILLYNLFKQ